MTRDRSKPLRGSRPSDIADGLAKRRFMVKLRRRLTVQFAAQRPPGFRLPGLALFDVDRPGAEDRPFDAFTRPLNSRSVAAFDRGGEGGTLAGKALETDGGVFGGAAIAALGDTSGIATGASFITGVGGSRRGTAAASCLAQPLFASSWMRRCSCSPNLMPSSAC